MRSDHLTKHAKRHPEFNLEEFIVAKRRLEDLALCGLEQVVLDMSASPSQQTKRKIFLPTTDNNQQTTTTTTTTANNDSKLNNNNNNNKL